MGWTHVSRDDGAIRTETVLVVAALIVVTAMIAVGLAGILSDDTADAARSRPSHVASPASATPASGPVLRDIVFFDVRSGETTPLPRSLRALPQSRRFLVSPDGQTFAFEAADGYQFQVYVANVEGRHVRQLTHGSPGARLGGWSPDGSSIVVATDDRPAPDGRISVINVGSGAMHPITHLGYVYAPSFSHDGNSIIYSQAREVHKDSWRTDLWRVAATGGRPTLLVAFGTLGTESPDGSTIAYHRTAIVPDDYCGICWWHDLRLTRVPSDGSRQPGQASGGSNAPAFVFESLLPQWSPDGHHILVGGPTSGAPSEIYLRSAHRGGGRQIAIGSDPTWFNEHTVIITDGERFTS